MKKLVVAAAVALLMTGCAAGTDTTDSAAPEVAPEPKYPATYRSVEELRDSFVEAGGACPDWVQENLIVAAAESGTCSTTNVLSVYTSQESKDEAVSTLKEIAISDLNLLVGENWVINDPVVASLDPELGGTLVSN